jgi:hypothetical protein
VLADYTRGEQAAPAEFPGVDSPRGATSLAIGGAPESRTIRQRTDCRTSEWSVLMATHRSRSNRILPAVCIALVLTASCGRGHDTPAAGDRPAANTAGSEPALPPTQPPPPPLRELTWSGKVDMQLWSPARVKAYKVALQRETPPVVAILRIPRLELEVHRMAAAGQPHLPARVLVSRRRDRTPVHRFLGNNWLAPAACCSASCSRSRCSGRRRCRPTIAMAVFSR